MATLFIFINKIMKKYLVILLSFLCFFWFSFAAELNFQDFLTVYFEWVNAKLKQNNTLNIWTKWQDIDVKYTNVQKNSNLYKALQKGIYLWIFPNTKSQLPLDRYLTQDMFVQLQKAQSDIFIPYTKWDKIDDDWAQTAINSTIIYIQENLKNLDLNFDDVKSRLQNESIYGTAVNLDNCSSISGCMDLIDDNFMEYYSPDEAQILYEELEWEFTGIWAYIWTDWAWLFGVSDVIEWWPAQKAGLLPGDIFIQIGNHYVTKNSTTTEISNWIKWQAWTDVTIKVKRWEQTLSFTIQRELITLSNVEYEILWWNICYMDIKQFNSTSLSQFQAWIRNFLMNWCDIIMFDLRNNAGGELNIVVNMLNNFVNSNDTIVEMRYANTNQEIIADSLSQKLNNKTVLVFWNWGTASASEIFLWAIKDNVKKSLFLWTNTYGKGTAQAVVDYEDGSALKYTVAKWYTWKSKKNIDWVWFAPDITLRDSQISALIQSLRNKK